MAKCYKCKSEINWLKCYTEVKHEFELDKKGEAVLNEVGENPIPTSFECPECDEELFTFEGDAVKFLQGGK